MKIIKIEKGHATLQLPDYKAIDYLEDIADEQMIFSPEGIIEDPRKIEAKKSATDTEKQTKEDKTASGKASGE